MIRHALRLSIAILVAAAVVRGGSASANDSSADRPADKVKPASGDIDDVQGLEGLDARGAVRRGNQSLREGRTQEALDVYDYAETLRPESPEIAFGQGLAHLELGQSEQARTAFERAASLAEGGLSDDALYSLGSVDHREALHAVENNPQLAQSLLERAMRRYHDVLSRRPDHRAAREANFKAASMWQQIKEQLQQQQRQQSENGEEENQENQTDQQPNEAPQGQQEDAERQPEPSSQPDSSQSEELPESAQASSEEQDKESPTQRESQEEVSREQAERRLREMMQAIRDRKKVRRPPQRALPITPVEKDW